MMLLVLVVMGREVQVKGSEEGKWALLSWACRASAPGWHRIVAELPRTPGGQCLTQLSPEKELRVSESRSLPSAGCEHWERRLS